MQTKVIINKLAKLTSREMLNESEQVAFFVWIRHLIQEEKIGLDYPTVFLYSNWVLHLNIDRQKECGAIITNTVCSLEKMEDQKSTLLGIIYFLRALHFKDLDKEFFEIFHKYSIPLTIFQNDRIFDFFNQLIKKLLIDKPLILNMEDKKYYKKEKEKHYNQITEETKGKEIMAIQYVSFYHNERYKAGDNDQKEAEYYVAYVNRNNNTIQVPMEFNIWRQVFSDRY